MNLKDIIAKQVITSRTGSFIEYNSKKKLSASGVLTKEQEEVIAQLKGTFTFNMHSENRYLIVTMYYSATKTYGFLVIDLTTLAVAESESIKIAKKFVLDQIEEDKKVVVPVIEQALEEIVAEINAQIEAEHNSEVHEQEIVEEKIEEKVEDVVVENVVAEVVVETKKDKKSKK